MNEMQEALSALNVQLAPEKFPAGSTVIAVKLGRDENRSGKLVEAIGRNWATSGMAVALKNGAVVAANYVFGSYSCGVPKVRACHSCCCSKCGKQMLLPLAVWEAKDQARRNKVPDATLDQLSGWELVRRYGGCSCGGRIVDNAEREKAELTEFTGNVLRAIERAEAIGPFVPPTAFLVRDAGNDAPDLGEGWSWLKKAMEASGKVAVPFVKDGAGDPLIYNPGSWLGWVEDLDQSGLFFLENGKDRKGRGRGFNPNGIQGL